MKLSFRDVFYAAPSWTPEIARYEPRARLFNRGGRLGVDHPAIVFRELFAQARPDTGRS